MEETKLHAIGLMDAMYLEYTVVHSMEFFKALCKEFDLKKPMFTSVKNEYESIDKVFLVDYKKGMQTDFRLVAVKLFFYDFCMEVVSKENYAKRIFELVTKKYPQFEDSEYTVKEEVLKGKFDLESIFLYAYGVFAKEDFDLYEINYVSMDSLNKSLQDYLEISDLESDKMYQKYIKKQIKNYLSYLKCKGESFEDLITRIEQDLIFFLVGADNNFNIQAYKFGYTIYRRISEVDYKLLIEETLLQEIKAVLKEKIKAYERENSESLSRSQIIILASIQDFELFHKRVIRSCVEYLYYKEIATSNREFVLKEFFDNKENVVQTEVIEKVSPADEKLLVQIEQLKQENESLKKKLLDTQKESDRFLKEQEKQSQKKSSDDEKSISNAKFIIRMWGAFCLILLDALNSDDEDILPYDLEIMQQKKIIFVGGREEVKQELRKLFPKAKFVETETGKLQSLDVDMVLFFTKYMNHSMFFKYIPKLRTDKIPFGFSASTNTEKILSDMYSWITGRKEFYNVEGDLK